MIRSTSGVYIEDSFASHSPPGAGDKQVLYVNLGRAGIDTSSQDIRDIEEQFGITNAKNAEYVGIVTRVPSGLRFFDLHGVVYLFCSRTVSPKWTADFFSCEPKRGSLDRIMQAQGVDDDPVAAWESSSFAIRLRKSDPTKTRLLKRVYDALLQKDAMIFLTKGVVGSPKELVIAVRSCMDANTLAKVRAGGRS
ncbi:hypothetical protein CL652_03180 [bacterium]|nr:hypothetical protein [bacterium]|tara:strand:+ start:4522 stop:5103 length:582 start_codon:yes stop_codon:yes gene_type:complete